MNQTKINQNVWIPDGNRIADLTRHWTIQTGQPFYIQALICRTCDWVVSQNISRVDCDSRCPVHKICG